MPTHSSSTSFTRLRVARRPSSPRFPTSKTSRPSLHAVSRAYNLCVPQLTVVRENGARRGLHGVHREVRLAHLREVQAGVRAIRGVVETVGVVRGLVDGREWGTALDGVDELHAMWDGPQAVLPPMPSRRGTLLPSVAEEGPPGDARGGRAAGGACCACRTSIGYPVVEAEAFAALPSQLQTLTQEITSSLTLDLVSVLKIGLSERVHQGRSSSDDHTDLADRLRPLIQGLVRTRNLRESVTVWRDVVLEEVQGIMQQVRLLTVAPTWSTIESASRRSTYIRLTLQMIHRRSPLTRGW
jgi:vacuolar protein sorting-associated protein 54